MRKWLILLMALCCTACTALPAEERAFAVVVCVERTGDTWQVYGRIPAYKTGGEYLTVQGQGATIPSAVAAMDASAPMKVTLSQLRLLVVSAQAEVLEVLQAMADNLDVQPQCVVAVTDEPAEKIMDTLVPQTGSRLSKMIDLLVESRVDQGVIPDMRLADAVCMGERQAPVLARLSLQDDQIELSGAWAAGAWYTPEEAALLSLLMGEAKELWLILPEGTAHIREAKASTVLAEDGRSARVTLGMEVTAADLPSEKLEPLIADAALALLTHLSRDGCDALGLGRQYVCHAQDMAAWHALNWPATYRDIRWTVEVGVNGPA